MYKLLFIMLIAGLGAIYFGKQKGFDFQKMNPMTRPTPTPVPSATPFIKNAYLTGECFTDTTENFSYARIVNFDGNTNMYSYVLCNKYKACATEEIKVNFNAFEKQFAADKKIECPPEIK